MTAKRGWQTPPIAREVRHVCRALARVYADTSLGNKQNPLDEYLYILLSLRTHERGYGAAYQGFKKEFPSWVAAYNANVAQIAKAIRAGGLARQKAKRLKAALRVINRQFGEVSLRKLRPLSATEIERFLLRLPGIGVKSARCIMMYSLGFDVLPVDTHVARIARRLGWVCSRSSKSLHEQLERIVPKGLRFSFHVSCVQHGRAVCRGAHPRCGACCLNNLCPRIGL